MCSSPDLEPTSTPVSLSLLLDLESVCIIFCFTVVFHCRQHTYCPLCYIRLCEAVPLYLHLAIERCQLASGESVSAPNACGRSSQSSAIGSLASDALQPEKEKDMKGGEGCRTSGDIRLSGWGYPNAVLYSRPPSRPPTTMYINRKPRIARVRPCILFCKLRPGFVAV